MQSPTATNLTVNFPELGEILEVGKAQMQWIKYLTLKKITLWSWYLNVFLVEGILTGS